MQPLRPHGHLAPPRLTTMWPISPAAPRPSHGLPSRTGRRRRRCPRRRRAARELASGAELELGFGRDLDVVADPDRGAELVFERLGEREAAVPAGQVLRRETTPVFSSASPGEPTPTPASSRSRRRRPRRPRASPRPSPRRRPRAAARRRRVARFAEHLALGVDDGGLDLRPTEVDPAPQGGLRARVQGFSPKPSVA